MSCGKSKPCSSTPKKKSGAKKSPKKTKKGCK